jgi:hypothetical protein
MTDLSPEARAILDAGRDGDGAGDLERARVRRALLAKIAAGGAVLAGSSAAAAPTATGTTAGAGGVAASASALPLAKLLVPLAILAAGGMGAGIAWKVRRDAAPAAATSVPARPPERLAPVSPEAPPPVAAPEPRSSPPRHTHVAARELAPPPTNRLTEETSLLASVNAALRGGESARALALLDDYDRRYPSGVLREEVLATRLIARCRLDDASSPGPAGASAKADAELFLARHPASPLAPRVRSSCAR